MAQRKNDASLGAYTKLALDIEKCEVYNPTQWRQVLQRAHARLDAPKRSKKRPRDVSSHAHCPSLNAYLHQPDMVADLLQQAATIETSPLRRGSSSTSLRRRSSVVQPEETGRVSLPILRVLTPRTRQWVARLPKPRDADVAAVNQLEAFADEAIHARHVTSLARLSHRQNVYGNLVRGTSPTKPLLGGRRQRGAPALAMDAVERRRMALEDINVALLCHRREVIMTHQSTLQIPPTPTRSHDKEASEAIQMQIDDRDVSDSTLATWLAWHRDVEKKHLTHLHEEHETHVADALLQERRVAMATTSLQSTLQSVQRWLPLDVLYGFGKGPFASLPIHRAMDRVHAALVRMRFNALLHGFGTWLARTMARRAIAFHNAALSVQCAWRQALARHERRLRHRLLQQQRQREASLLARLLTKKDAAARILTRTLRRYAVACTRARSCARIEAATRLQRFYRQRTARWARFLQLLRHRKETAAAIRVQAQVRGWLARRRRTLLRKLDAVALRAHYAAVVAATKAYQLRLLGAVLLVQRTLRRRRFARKAKFAAMRRRHAKNVITVVQLQAWWRMVAAYRSRRRYALRIGPAASVLQRAWRRYRSQCHLKHLKEARANAIKARKLAKKNFRKDQRQLLRQRSQAKGVNKLLLQVTDTVTNVFREPTLAQKHKAATTLQAAFRGAKTRRRVRRLRVRSDEATRRRHRRRQHVAATTIQRMARGMLGRMRYWRLKVHAYARRIQVLFRSRKARQAILDVQRYVHAAGLIKRHWLQKKRLVEFRRTRRAAVRIQAIARRYLQQRDYVRLVQKRQRRLEQHAIGAARLPSTLRFVQDTLLLWSYQFPYVASSKTAPNASVQRPLQTRLDDKTTWVASGCYGVWQSLFLALCRYGNTPDATEMDNMRFSKFFKDTPGALHKVHLPLHAVDVAFAKVKVGKARSIPFAAFHTAMGSLLAARFPDPTLQPSSRYLLFLHKVVLPSKLGEPFRLQLATLALERAHWAAHVIQSMVRHALQRARRAAFLVRFRDAQNRWRSRRARLQFDALVRETYVEYVNGKSGAKSYKNLVTGVTTYSRPALLRDMPPTVSILLPPPDEEYIVYCMKHESQPREKATIYCLECDDAVCADCFARDHKRAAFTSHATLPIELCRLCTTQTATRRCNQCMDGGAPYCDACYPHYHRTRPHTFTALVALCVECQAKAGAWRCTVCTDYFCKKCYSNFHRKGQRQHHGIERVAYLPFAAKAILDARATDAARLAQASAVDSVVSAQLSELDVAKQDIAARMIQAAFRAMKGRVEGKAYMKLIRRTNWIVQQRVKDDVVRRGLAYKLKKAIGVAEVLASDTDAEAAAIAARKAAIKDALGLSTYDNSNGPPPWCTYDAPVLITRGEFKSCEATIVSTNALVDSGNVLVFIADAHKSVLMPLRDLRPMDRESGGPMQRLTQSLAAASQKVHAKVLAKVDAQSLAIKLLHHRTEFKDIEEHAWLPSRDHVTGENTYWNVVSNCTTTTKPRTLAALDTMEATAKAEMRDQVLAAKTKLTALLRKTDRGAGDRRGSFDAAVLDATEVRRLHDALFWADHMHGHPRLGKKAQDLTNHLSTTQLMHVVQFFNRLQSAVAADQWDASLLQLVGLPRDAKVQFATQCAEMGIQDGIASLESLAGAKTKKAAAADDADRTE
ncbi:hypothetical protein SPRG_01406 [Saprolegnia parasitica CBS 223.65]|uniref:B box-type domain-containing protein n=1 Tax=Saprolegnia parasitica (strain CBS 223.65) TaxID=695850 RepID=A0A067D624_SAPPC|nr:hypothetical protein SPRG_01406 [Saprolegnia parasitica CBS 223.65]KDO34136.1 hypothetical protein SPRG_01406 [Saprolegnia parasitica CBS 223.65]|eukprot:XP_012195013.1 hypothetical protein SPRG_01406 [Saprolegnia parasitica CBS 223.65]